jgi:signal transduction histidine kinase
VEPRAPLSRRALLADIAVAALTALASLIALLATIPDAAHPYAVSHIHGAVLAVPANGPAPGVPLAGLLAIAGTTVPLAARRVRPLLAYLIVVSCAMVGHGYLTGVTFIAVLFAGYSAVVHSRYRGAALLSVPAAGVVAAAAFPNTTPPLPGRFSALLVLVLVAIVGNATRIWLRRAGDSQARLVSMRAEHEAATRRALELERARVASELHDIVTHNVSVMVVQAGAARQVLSASPHEATAALLAVEASGRDALTELRHLLGLLAPTCDGGAPCGAGDAGPGDGGAAALRPQPGLGQLRPLIDRVTGAGLPVELRIGGHVRDLPTGLDLAAYRVVQEALTNVMRHAGHARTTVRLDYGPNVLDIEVADDGAAPGAPRVDAGPGAGRGLLGLRERVELYGGTLDAGRRPGGGWRTLARIPLEPITAPVP